MESEGVQESGCSGLMRETDILKNGDRGKTEERMKVEVRICK